MASLSSSPKAEQLMQLLQGEISDSTGTDGDNADSALSPYGNLFRRHNTEPYDTPNTASFDTPNTARSAPIMRTRSLDDDDGDERCVHRKWEELAETWKTTVVQQPDGKVKDGDIHNQQQSLSSSGSSQHSISSLPSVGSAAAAAAAAMHANYIVHNSPITMTPTSTTTTTPMSSTATTKSNLTTPKRPTKKRNYSEDDKNLSLSKLKHQFSSGGCRGFRTSRLTAYTNMSVFDRLYGQAPKSTSKKKSKKNKKKKKQPWKVSSRYPRPFSPKTPYLVGEDGDDELSATLTSPGSSSASAWQKSLTPEQERQPAARAVPNIPKLKFPPTPTTTKQPRKSSRSLSPVRNRSNNTRGARSLVLKLQPQKRSTARSQSPPRKQQPPWKSSSRAPRSFSELQAAKDKTKHSHYNVRSSKEASSNDGFLKATASSWSKAAQTKVGNEESTLQQQQQVQDDHHGTSPHQQSAAIAYRPQPPQGSSNSSPWSTPSIQRLSHPTLEGAASSGDTAPPSLCMPVLPKASEADQDRNNSSPFSTPRGKDHQQTTPDQTSKANLGQAMTPEQPAKRMKYSPMTLAGASRVVQSAYRDASRSIGQKHELMSAFRQERKKVDESQRCKLFQTPPPLRPATPSTARSTPSPFSPSPGSLRAKWKAQQPMYQRHAAANRIQHWQRVCLSATKRLDRMRQAHAARSIQLQWRHHRKQHLKQVADRKAAEMLQLCWWRKLSPGETARVDKATQQHAYSHIPQQVQQFVQSSRERKEKELRSIILLQQWWRRVPKGSPEMVACDDDEEREPCETTPCPAAYQFENDDLPAKVETEATPCPAANQFENDDLPAKVETEATPCPAADQFENDALPAKVEKGANFDGIGVLDQLEMDNLHGKVQTDSHLERLDEVEDDESPTSLEVDKDKTPLELEHTQRPQQTSEPPQKTQKASISAQRLDQQHQASPQDQNVEQAVLVSEVDQTHCTEENDNFENVPKPPREGMGGGIAQKLANPAYDTATAQEPRGDLNPKHTAFSRNEALSKGRMQFASTKEENAIRTRKREFAREQESHIMHLLHVLAELQTKRDKAVEYILVELGEMGKEKDDAISQASPKAASAKKPLEPSKLANKRSIDLEGIYRQAFAVRRVELFKMRRDRIRAARRLYSWWTTSLIVSMSIGRRRRAATKLQAAIRGHRFCIVYRNVRLCVIQIQSWWRGRGAFKVRAFAEVRRHRLSASNSPTAANAALVPGTYPLPSFATVKRFAWSTFVVFAYTSVVFTFFLFVGLLWVDGLVSVKNNRH
ncbi:expressed unknown protein [Seminavis robusta]|uniref:Uncharacterized protein n=1 Tax=Seminavis robusta TaxID=568900 RepID=A0A9N8EPU9_9STRA|nr:expressed unknown protein [Seminavis robusta]|eukprot:Sro1625_g286780.1 n/a (1282) ;mRNA; f:16549-20394